MYTPATADPGPRYVAGATPTGRVEIRDSFGAHPDVVLAPAEAERLALRLIWAAAKAREAAPDGPDAESSLLPGTP